MKMFIKRENDETLEILLGKTEVGYANHDEHGWSGMIAVEDLARNMAKKLKIEIVED